MLIKHLKDGLRRPYGTLVCDVIDGEVRHGLSIVNPKDRFNKKFGIKIASGRMYAGTFPDIPNRYVFDGVDFVDISSKIKEELNAITVRALKYQTGFSKQLIALTTFNNLRSLT